MGTESTDVERLRSALRGRVSAPGDPDWDEARFGFNVGVDPRPRLVAIPADADDVAAVLRFAREAGLRVAPQSTAHNPVPLGTLEDSILLRTTALGGVEIDRDARRARVGAGARWADLVPAASELGLAALHGSSPNVGIVGYHLGGGLGWYGRKHGLACNSVVAMDVVTADGERRRVDASSEPDLFWALRGGGGSFAVVTALELELLPIPEVYAGALFFPAERAGEVLNAWLEWTVTAPEEVTSVGRLMNFPPIPDVPEPLRGGSFTVLEAICIGGEEQWAEALAPLAALEPAMSTFAAQPPAGIADLHMDPPGPVKGVSCHRLLDGVGPGTIDDLLAAAGPGSGSTITSVEVRHTGGALAREEEGCGALGRLPGSFCMFAVSATMDPAQVGPAEEQIGRVDAALAAYDAGLYLPFCETAGDHFPAAFSPEACERLRTIRAAHDPDRLLRPNHELG